MGWYTTTEAANILQVSPSRVRQLVAKYRENQSLVRSTEGKNQVSDKLIELHLSNVAAYKAEQEKLEQPAVKIDTATPHDSPNTFDALYSALEGLENGLHVLPNGNHVQIFTEQEYSSFEEQLLEARGLALRLTQEKERREFAERQLEERNKTLNNTLGIIEKSLRNIDETLQQRKRDQYIEYEKLKKGDN